MSASRSTSMPSSNAAANKQLGPHSFVCWNGCSSLYLLGTTPGLSVGKAFFNESGISSVCDVGLSPPFAMPKEPETKIKKKLMLIASDIS